MQTLGRYELLRPLARGGMAEVFLARRRAAGVEKRLVIKRILAERARDPRFLELFVREARLSMALAHQNIVPVFDFGRIGDALFLAMEHVEGHDLGRTLARAPRLPPVVAAFVAAECCQALDHAHHRRGPDGVALGVVHRDVTPRNVLVSDAGDVKLVDFGVAALGGEGPERVRGTPAYMAPEQARGEPTDGRADLYALGLVLWEMLTGERVRRGADVAALMAEARAGVLPPVPTDVPPALAAVLARATAAAPADRYAEAHAMFDDLDSYVVATRAAEPANEAPKRRLAAWLRAAWAGDDPAVEVAGELIAGPVVTFIDDGADAVIDRTARSLADTIGEVASESVRSAPVIDPVIAPVIDPVIAPAPAPLVAPAPERGPAAPEAVASARARRWIPLGVGLVAVVGIGVVAWPRSGERVDAPIAIAASDAGIAPMSTDAAVAAVAPDAAVAPAAVVAPDAAVVQDARIASDAAITLDRPRADAHAHAVLPVDAAPASIDAGAPAVRRVTIGATPWANFTIDDNPTTHQTPETVELSPGRHVVHFDNPELRVARDVTLDVPVDHDLRHVEPMNR